MTALPITPNTDEWLKERKKHIGASEAAVVLGCSTWMTRRGLALEKLSDDIDNSDPNGYLKRGHVLEPLVKKLYEDATGNQITQASMYVHNDYSFMSATPDGIVIDKEDDSEILLECKTANRYRKSDWTNDEGLDCVPKTYWIQVQHQMAVTNKNRVQVAVLFAEEETLKIFTNILDNGGKLENIAAICESTDSIEFRVNTVLRDDTFIEIMIREEKAFWEQTQAGEVPDDYTIIQDTGEERVSTEHEEMLIFELKHAYINEKRWANKISDIKDQLAQGFGYASAIISEFGKVTYKKPATPRKTTKWKPVAEEIANVTNSQHLLKQVVERNSSLSSTRTMRVPDAAWKKEV